MVFNLTRRRSFPVLVAQGVLLLGIPAVAQAQLPRVFFTDLDSGPNSGGENNRGVFVTIAGNRFGATRGTSTVRFGGGEVATYVAWSNTKIVVELGSLAATGEVVVTTAAGASVGGPTFTVRAGTIYCVKSTGTDSGAGTYASGCWRTLPYAIQNAALGGIIYSHGVSQTTGDNQGWSAAITLRNTWCGLDPGGYPRALLAYPGTTVTVGAVGGTPHFGIRSTDGSAGGGACTGGWTFAGMNIRGMNALQLDGQSRTAPSTKWRIINNDLSCPNGTGADACFHTARTGNPTKFLGNVVHDAGYPGPPTSSALYHGVYFSTDSNYFEAGWNHIYNIWGCRGIQTHSSSGYDMHDISIHDNLIHDTQCDGIILATVDPSQGSGVHVFNNVIYNAGTGPNNPEMSGAWNCIFVPGYLQAGPPGSGTVEVYNNTMYNCGPFADPPYASRGGVRNGGNNANLKVRIRNNIIYQLSAAAPYWYNESSAPDGIYGNNNLFYGIGAPPASSYVTNSVVLDPLFVSASGADFRLLTNSPAATAGVNTGLLFDFDGVSLPQGAGYPIGAFALFSGSTAISPPPFLTISSVQ
jgi:hypothetical protein